MCLVNFSSTIPPSRFGNCVRRWQKTNGKKVEKLVWHDLWYLCMWACDHFSDLFQLLRKKEDLHPTSVLKVLYNLHTSNGARVCNIVNSQIFLEVMVLLWFANTGWLKQLTSPSGLALYIETLLCEFRCRLPPVKSNYIPCSDMYLHVLRKMWNPWHSR